MSKKKGNDTLEMCIKFIYVKENDKKSGKRFERFFKIYRF